MRPNNSGNHIEVYECFECGSRITAPDARVCDACDGELRHIGKSRDL